MDKICLLGCGIPTGLSSCVSQFMALPRLELVNITLSFSPPGPRDNEVTNEGERRKVGGGGVGLGSHSGSGIKPGITGSSHGGCLASDFSPFPSSLAFLP